MFRTFSLALLVTALITGSATADTVWYVGAGYYDDGTNPAVEASFLADPMAGPQIPGLEGFEEPDDDYFMGISNPLNEYSDDEAFDPGDIEANLNIASPGGDLWWVSGDYGYAFDSDQIMTSTSGDEYLELTFGPGQRPWGVSMRVGDSQPSPSSVTVTAYGADDAFLGSATANGFRYYLGDFVGVWSDVPIGRITIVSDTGEQEIVDSIKRYAVPEPITLTMLAAGALALVRRRP